MVMKKQGLFRELEKANLLLKSCGSSVQMATNEDTAQLATLTGRSGQIATNEDTAQLATLTGRSGQIATSKDTA